MTWWWNKCFSEFVVGDYYRLNKTLRGCSGSRFCLHQSVGSRFPLNTEAGNPSRRWKARISPSGVSSSLSGWGVIPGADRHAAPTWRPIGWCCCRSEWWCLWRTCGRKSPERGEAGMLLWSVLPGQVQWKQEFLNSLSETSARRSGAGFTLKQLSIFLTGRLHVWPLKPCDLWKPQFERNRKSLQSCRLSVSTWDEACWGGTGRCLGPRLMEPSTTAEPQTDPACWSLVGSTPNPRYFSSIFKLVCGLFCASPFKQREKTK